MNERPGAFVLGISTELLRAEHAQALGGALWVFLVLRSWQTERDGAVAHGEEIKVSEIAAHLGCNERTVRMYLDTLARGNYIDLRRTYRGLRIRILRFGGRSHALGRPPQRALPLGEAPLFGEAAPPVVADAVLLAVSTDRQGIEAVWRAMRTRAAAASEPVTDEEIAAILRELAVAPRRQPIGSYQYLVTAGPERLAAWLEQRRRGTAGGSSGLSPAPQTARERAIADENARVLARATAHRKKTQGGS